MFFLFMGAPDNYCDQRLVKSVFTQNSPKQMPEYHQKKKIENRYVDYMLRTGLVNDNTYFDKITDAYYSKQLGEEINGAINKLPERCREIFRLSRFEEMSYKEIAERLSISPKTVENQMGIALAKLKAALNKFLTFFSDPLGVAE